MYEQPNAREKRNRPLTMALARLAKHWLPIVADMTIESRISNHTRRRELRLRQASTPRLFKAAASASAAAMAGLLAFKFGGYCGSGIEDDDV